jgi:hypothetical protein
MNVRPTMAGAGVSVLILKAVFTVFVQQDILGLRTTQHVSVSDPDLHLR